MGNQRRDFLKKVVGSLALVGLGTGLHNEAKANSIEL